jgi:hypothetical protein
MIRMMGVVLDGPVLAVLAIVFGIGRSRHNKRSFEIQRRATSIGRVVCGSAVMGTSNRRLGVGNAIGDRGSFVVLALVKGGALAEVCRQRITDGALFMANVAVISRTDVGSVEVRLCQRRVLTGGVCGELVNEVESTVEIRRVFAGNNNVELVCVMFLDRICGEVVGLVPAQGQGRRVTKGARGLHGGLLFLHEGVVISRAVHKLYQDKLDWVS